jgi:hypothetical protein
MYSIPGSNGFFFDKSKNEKEGKNFFFFHVREKKIIDIFSVDVTIDSMLNPDDERGKDLDK